MQTLKFSTLSLSNSTSKTCKGVIREICSRFSTKVSMATLSITAKNWKQPSFLTIKECLNILANNHMMK